MIKVKEEDIKNLKDGEFFYFIRQIFSMQIRSICRKTVTGYRVSSGLVRGLPRKDLGSIEYYIPNTELEFLECVKELGCLKKSSAYVRSIMERSTG